MRFFSVSLPLRDACKYYLDSQSVAKENNTLKKLKNIYLSNFMAFFFTSIVSNWSMLLPTNLIKRWRKDSLVFQKRSSQLKIKKYYQDYGKSRLEAYLKVLEFRRPGGLGYFLCAFLRNWLTSSIFDTIRYLLPPQNIIYKILTPICATALSYLACFVTVPIYNLGKLKGKTYNSLIMDKVSIDSKSYWELMAGYRPEKQIQLIKKPPFLQILSLCITFAVYEQLKNYSNSSTKSQ